ncbi:HD domain-containing protein [Candidatus Dojkabacteria bacterium]|uniref:HD domain-containing protein n=1 Tax=Candidatus Dojkabacteria bacterium TaxID=2099670 RepID=A0A955RJ40_9BACT|nr:HD domain-containing protein [Candidatus Dojkabacteria bacterium]
MNQQAIISQTADMLKEKFSDESSGHDWWHIFRVWKNAITIGKKEGANLYVVELAALLHDIADYKFHDGDEKIGGEVSKQWMQEVGVDSETIEAVVDIVNNVSFKGGKNAKKMQSIEGQAVQDADRLDAIGAIGIARCFAYGGYKGNEMYNPDKEPNLNMSKEEYKTQKGTQINHFYEKLLLLKDLMNTKTGKEMANARHDYMLNYLDEFYSEWKGEK